MTNSRPMTYVPLRASVVQPPPTDSGQACWQQCQSPAETCGKGCGPDLIQLVQKCKAECADQQDRC